MNASSDTNLRIAVATKHGIAVDLHFGHARIFHIYDVSADSVTLVTVRDVDNYCTGEERSDETREQTLRRIAQALMDVRILLVAKIGDSPKEFLSSVGLAVSDEYAHSSIQEAGLALRSKAK